MTDIKRTLMAADVGIAGVELFMTSDDHVDKQVGFALSASSSFLLHEPGTDERNERAERAVKCLLAAADAIGKQYGHRGWNDL